jgi:transposase
MRGRSGHKPGNALMQVANPTPTVAHVPELCGGCGAGLAGAPRAGAPQIRQVFDIPKMGIEVTSHELHALTCTGCGNITRAAASAEARAPGGP